LDHQNRTLGTNFLISAADRIVMKHAPEGLVRYLMCKYNKGEYSRDLIVSYYSDHKFNQKVQQEAILDSKFKPA
jgi:hypothetical protein